MKPDSTLTRLTSVAIIATPAGLIIAGYWAAGIGLGCVIAVCAMVVQYRSRWKRRTFKRLYGE